MWTPTTRKQHNRKTNRYQTDVTDAEWRVIEPHLPAAKETGRPRAWPMREIINGIFYVMRAGCPWRLLPSDLPPWGTIYRWFAQFRDEGRFEKINHALVMRDRERIGRQSSPTGAVIDSQSVKTTEAGGPRGYDAGKKINGRKRHALVDTDGRGLVLEPHPASIQDRDGGGPLSASPSTPGAGSLNGSSPGSGATGARQKTSRPPSPPHAPSSTPPPSCSSSAASRGLHDFRNRLLAFPVPGLGSALAPP